MLNRKAPGSLHPREPSGNFLFSLADEREFKSGISPTKSNHFPSFSFKSPKKPMKTFTANLYFVLLLFLWPAAVAGGNDSSSSSDESSESTKRSGAGVSLPSVGLLPRALLTTALLFSPLSGVAGVNNGRGAGTLDHLGAVGSGGLLQQNIAFMPGGNQMYAAAPPPPGDFPHHLEKATKDEQRRKKAHKGSRKVLGKKMAPGKEGELSGRSAVVAHTISQKEHGQQKEDEKAEGGSDEEKEEMNSLHNDDDDNDNYAHGKTSRELVRYLRELPPLTGNISIVHDPSLVRAAGGKYVLYCSHDGMAERQADNAALTHWTRNGAVFPNGLPLAKRLTGNAMEFWAPDVSGPYAGKYLLYYAVPDTVSECGKGKKCSHTATIGVATSSTGMPSSWNDQGTVISSSDSDLFNAIDPNLFVDAATGKWWLTFGSYWRGIHQAEVDPRSGKLMSPGAPPHNIARRSEQNPAVEAPFLYQRNDWYYLFVSFDHCCMGLDSTYSIRVGRARSPNGPFKDRANVAMLAGGGSLVLGAAGHQVGPGGQSVLSTEQGDLLVYHFYDRDHNGAPTLGLKLLDWSADGWPTA